MAGLQPNFQANPSEVTPTPETAANPTVFSPSAAPSPSDPFLSSADLVKAPYKVFISHAGEDKVTIAFPLREKLQERGITAFVDKKDMLVGMEAKPAMLHAMHTASVGVFVMSPEFVARKWPMKELMYFLNRRDACIAAGHEAPTILPFFYRLGISDLYDEPRLDRNDKDGNKLYEVSRFYERQRNGEPEANIAGIKAALRKLLGIMGVENFGNADNDIDYKMSVNRTMILDLLCNWICKDVPGLTLKTLTITQPTSGVIPDAFRPNFDIAYDVSELVFDFDRKDSNGDICTQEGKILQMLLDESMDRNRTIAVRGIGGVGKTSLLRKIRSLKKVFERFKDGLYYIEMGKEPKRGGLKEALISVVSRSGGKQAAMNMRKETDMGKVMEIFRSWFSQKQCLFVIDNVWNTAEVTLVTIRHLWNMHSSGRDSKVLLTTRSIDIATYGSVCVYLQPREPLEGESRAILYHYAGLNPEPGKDEDNGAVDEILERCAGLPLFLNVAGKSVKTLSFRRGHEGCIAYRFYSEQLQKSMGEMFTTETESYKGLSKGLRVSIDLVEERTDRFEFDVVLSMAEMHRRLSVMRKQMRVPMRMLKNLWQVEHESQAARIAKEFEQVGLADVEFKEKGCEVMEVLRLHDSVYEFAVYEMRRCKQEEVGHKKVLEGYAKALQTSGTQREWWSEDLEDDKYIHRNVCRHLVGAGLEDELFGLLLAPKWLERQVELNGVAFAEVDFSVGTAAIQKWKHKGSGIEDDEIEEAFEMIREAITLSSSYVLNNERELWFQVHGRLKRAAEYNTLIREYERKIESDAPKPGVLCMKRLLMEVGGANMRIAHVGTGVVCMVLLKDGERVACGCDNGYIAIVNMRRSETEMRWRAHDKWVNAIDVGKHGTRILSGSWDETAKVWNPHSCECVARLHGHSDDVICVAITEDGKRVVSGSDDGTVQVWDVETGRRAGPSICPNYYVNCLTVFRDGEHIVLGGWNGKLEIWNVTTNTKVGASFHGHTNSVSCVALTEDESGLVSGSDDRTVRLWDIQTRQQVGHSFEGHTRRVRCVAMSHDGSRIVSGSDDKTIQVWDVEGGEQVCDPLIGHTNDITGVTFLGERHKIVSCSKDGTVRLWNLKRKRKETAVDKHNSRVKSVSFTANGKFVMSESLDGALRVWDSISGQAVGEPLLNENSSDINGMAVTPDGQFAVSVSEDKRVRLWDLQTREVACTFEGHTDRVRCVAITPDGERAVTGSWDRTVCVWELKSMDGSHFVLEGHRDYVTSVFIADDGKRIISVDYDDNIFVWNIETQMLMRETKEEDAQNMTRRQVLGLVGEATVHDEDDLSVSLEGNGIVHGEGSEAGVLGTLESTIRDWDISPDKQTICVGLQDGRVGLLKLLL